MNDFDFEKLQDTGHMLKWLADDPQAAIRAEVESILDQQVPGSRLLRFQVLSAPQWLTGALPSDDGSSMATVVRAGVAFAFALAVRSPDAVVHELQGVYSWVGVHLNDPAQHRQRTWFDLGGDLAVLGSQGELKTRMYFA